MKPLQPRKDTKAQESAWALRVKKRDKYLCQFESVLTGLRCLQKASDAAHVYRRFYCGKAKFNDDVGMAACRTCHVEFDTYTGTVRVPLGRQRAAWDAITAVCKIPLPGERP
jgi:hypothetical protein